MEVAKKLKQLNNVNVVRFRGYSTHPAGMLFEYCSVSLDEQVVHNLSDLISIFNDNDYFHLKERLSYIMQATKGLNYLHRRGIIHRNFKPNNLRDLKDIIVNVSDFDGMFILKETISVTATSFHMKGMTLAYTAPEICSRTVPGPTKKSDIFSWAISCYEILSSLSCPWEKVLPSLNDVLLNEALSRGVRPVLEDLDKLYQDEDIGFMKKLIKVGGAQ